MECVGLNMYGPQRPRVLDLSIGSSTIKGHGLDGVGMALWGMCVIVGVGSEVSSHAVFSVFLLPADQSQEVSAHSAVPICCNSPHQDVNGLNI